ncbi:MAG: nucleotide exchange factor GrpE [Proteobacteria bacterium]|nr:nucleotide exchange factor GrpE [Pseudomonadota bacterium]
MSQHDDKHTPSNPNDVSNSHKAQDAAAAPKEADAHEPEIEVEVEESQMHAQEDVISQENVCHADPSEPSESEAEVQPGEEIKQEKDATNWKTAYIRLAADFDNFRKRTSKEFDDVRRRERERVIGDWLDVYDNTERAISALPEKEGPWFEGFVSILRQMDKCLANLSIKAADDMGQPFNPKRHEAIATLPNPSLPDNTIAYVERRGFVYGNGDIARIARVVVVKNPS